MLFIVLYKVVLPLELLSDETKKGDHADERCFAVLSRGATIFASVSRILNKKFEIFPVSVKLVTHGSEFYKRTHTAELGS